MLSSTQHRPLIARIAEWWRSQRRKHAALDELDACGRDIEEIARDVGVSASDLRKLAGSGPAGADLLRRRLAELHLDRNAISRAEPEAMRDLERVCTLCGSKGRCEHDLAVNPDDPGWRDYCPNVQTLEAIEEEAAERRLLHLGARRKLSSGT